MKPYPFQTECARAVDKFNGRALFCCSMGLGKSAMSLWHAAKHRAFPLVIVCPASLKWQWEAEVEKVLGRMSEVCEGMKPDAILENIVIINYDILDGWLTKLKSLRPAMVVIDECQYIMNPKAKRTKNVRELCRGVKRVLALSGTPLINRPIELFPTLNILRPLIFRSRFQFGIEYCGGRRSKWGWEFKGATKTKELHQLLLKTCMIRKTKSEVLPDLPDKIRTIVPVSLRDRFIYEAAEEDFISWLREQDPKKAKRAMRAEALMKAGYLLRLSAKLKCKSVVEWVNDWLDESERKLILFCMHRKMVEAMYRRIAHGSVIVDGRVKGRDRAAAVKKFRTDPQTRVLIGNVQAAGVGLNLVEASDVAFAELPWQPGAVSQAEDRCHRIGQVKGVNVYYLVAHNTVEEKRCQIIAKKQAVLSAVLDGGRTVDDVDVFDSFLEANVN